MTSSPTTKSSSESSRSLRFQVSAFDFVVAVDVEVDAPPEVEADLPPEVEAVEARAKGLYYHRTKVQFEQSHRQRKKAGRTFSVEAIAVQATAVRPIAWPIAFQSVFLGLDPSTNVFNFAISVLVQFDGVTIRPVATSYNT